MVLGLFAEATALRCWIVSFSSLDSGLVWTGLLWVCSGLVRLDERTGGDSISIVFASVVSANKDIIQYSYHENLIDMDHTYQANHCHNPI